MNVMMRCTVLATSLIGGAYAVDSSANEYWFRVQAEAWFTPLGGAFGYNNVGGTPTSISADEIGLGDSETALMAEGSFKIPFFLDIHIGLIGFSTSGSSTLTRSVDFGDETFTVGETITSSVDISDFYGELAWGINTDLVGASIGLAVHFMGIEGSINSPSLSKSATFDKSTPVPMLALRGHANPFAGLGVEAVLHGLSLSVDDVDANVLDIRLQVIYRPIAMAGIIAGYRHFVLDIEIDDGNDQARLDLDLSGPFAGLLVQF